MDFGNYMRGVRENAHQTLLAAATGLEVSRQVIMRMEEGSPTKLTTPLIGLLLDHYGASPEVCEEALRLWSEIVNQDKVAKAQGNSKGFWKAYTDQLAPTFPKFLRLEGAANRIIAHQPVIVPGLLQISEYRRAIIRIDEPDLSPVNVERLLELTTRRQARLTETGFRLEVLISEAVLRHCPASPPVMAAQLRWIAEIGDRENVSIRVIPFAVGPHRGLTIQPFTLLEFPKASSGIALPSVVFVEGAIGSLYHERVEEIDQYREAIGAMQAVALTKTDTRDMVLALAKEYAA
ncbi:XRE family transcriptional regulator [Nocardia sp. ET3-3]|uniref:XRE family transcriptional regulator n=1 Tax=Nocardia terrae TaxID=2675851 RepID=A0A7K1URG8_9NOCA|nr:helix-turn-helix transcriptional regulator [Nocardia terrae]MVU76921.1 XRE family transcriptional regulator [Nocardia terrae]